MLGNGLWCLKSALVADFVDRYTPHRVCSTHAIRCPPIGLIKALRADVTRQNPQSRISKSESKKAGTRGRHKGYANTPAPLFRIYIERTQLSMVHQIQFA